MLQTRSTMRTGRAVKGTEFSMDENSSAPSNLTSSPASGGCVRKSRVRDSTTTTTCLSQRKSMNVEVKPSRRSRYQTHRGIFCIFITLTVLLLFIIFATTLVPLLTGYGKMPMRHSDEPFHSTESLETTFPQPIRTSSYTTESIRTSNFITKTSMQSTTRRLSTSQSQMPTTEKYLPTSEEYLPTTEEYLSTTESPIPTTESTRTSLWPSSTTTNLPTTTFPSTTNHSHPWPSLSTREDVNSTTQQPQLPSTRRHVNSPQQPWPPMSTRGRRRHIRRRTTHGQTSISTRNTR